MTMRSESVLKTFFETGDTPSQSQFGDFIESYPNLSDNNQLTGVDSTVAPVFPAAQGTAYAIGSKYNFVPSVGTATGAVVLPAATQGRGLYITNSDTVTMTVFPASGEKLKLLATDSGYLIYPGETFFFYAQSTGVWAWSTPDPQNGLAFEYSACLTQTSTNAPTATVARNTLPDSPVWSHFAAGIYRFTATGLWTAGKTFLYGPGGDSLGNKWGMLASSTTDYIILRTWNSGGSTVDGLLSDTPFTFMVSRI